ncbi:hypothetical protein ACLMAL_34780 [Nocardia sp. CWNU-33]|uniref:hypothetical protein n=1 Tax=Nocardia sp. CWNU-33 TaxID=3392117 RepID=UPI00398EEBA1
MIGETLHSLATDHLPYTLVDYYGPIEAAIFATYRVLEAHSEWQPASIGVPIMDTEAFIFVDRLDELPDGEVVELCLAGGYLDPQLTAERFIQSAKLGRGCIGPASWHVGGRCKLSSSSVAATIRSKFAATMLAFELAG